jgi:hypothetical protein
MSATIINAAPTTISRGTKDLSTTAPVRVAEAIPQHLPKFYIYAQKGIKTPFLGVGASLSEMYGVDTFDQRLKYANHATEYLNQVNSEGNAVMVERIVPEDAGPEANMFLSLDLLATTVPEYERNADGTYLLDSGTGLPVPTGESITGYKAKWILSHATTVSALGTSFGARGIANGDQTDAVLGTQSKRYPIMDLKASSQGEIFNLSGLRLWAPDATNSSGVSSKILTVEKAYPFRASVIRKPSVTTSAAVVETTSAEQYVDFVFKPGAVDPVSTKQLYIGDVLVQSFEQTDDPLYPAKYGDFGELHTYDANIKAVLALVYAAEVPFIDSFSDFNGATDEQYLFNLISGVSSGAVPYHSYQILDTANSVHLTEYSNLFAAGGSDGTMSDELFAELVTARVMQYANADSYLMDTAINVESIMYDSGFPLATKKAMASFIAIRKDTMVVLSTHDANEPELTASEESALSVALRTYLEFYPESDYFGTPVMRGMIMGRSGTLRNSLYKKKVSTSIELAIKAAKYMGAGNGEWKNGFNFDGAPGSILDYVYKLNVEFTPSTVRNKDWTNGLNWAQAYDRRQLFFPALKTVYNDDTSVLNSFITVMACVQIQKVLDRAWRELSGVSGLTNAQLVEKTNKFITKNVLNRFDGRFVIEPVAYLTDADVQRGYSWTVPVNIYAPNMKTVMTTEVRAQRIDNYTASSV